MGEGKHKKVIAGCALFVALMLLFGSFSLKESTAAQIKRTVANAEAKTGVTTIPEGSLKIDAKAAVLLDANGGTMLYEQNSHEKLPPASVTKIMTMLLVLEAVDQGLIHMDDPVNISERAAGMGGSQLYMEAGETQTVETLLTGISLCSANDACVAMAEYVGGTEEIFVENMNRRAKELGMKDTNFINTNGLPVAGHYTSAYDIGLMSKELLKYEKTKEWFNTWQTKITVGLSGKKQTELGLTNTNRLIKQYPGANGIKTGFTQEAGYCLSGSATREDTTLIAVVLGSSASKLRFAETGRLLDYGFATYESVKIAEKNQVMGTASVEKGTPLVINAICGERVGVLVKKGQKEHVTVKIKMNEKITAPLQKGEKIGALVLLTDGKKVKTYPLLAEDKVEKAGFLELYIRMLKTLIR